MPSWPDIDKIFIPGDEIMVALCADKSHTGDEMRVIAA